MPLVSIIGCESSIKDLVELLAEDNCIDRLAVVNGRSQSILKDLNDLKIEHEVLSSDSLPAGLNKDDGFNVILTLQSNSLRNDSLKLKRETYEKVRFYGEISDSVLIFYDSCDGAFNSIFNDFRKPSFSLKTLSMQNSSLSDADANSKLLNFYNRCCDKL